jgi:hypothetical protein
MLYYPQVTQNKKSSLSLSDIVNIFLFLSITSELLRETASDPTITFYFYLFFKMKVNVFK